MKTKILKRNALLMQLGNAYPLSLPLSSLRLGISLAGWKLSDELIERELQYLIEKRFVEKSELLLSAEEKRYKLTAIGLDYLEREGLI